MTENESRKRLALFMVGIIVFWIVISFFVPGISKFFNPDPQLLKVTSIPPTQEETPPQPTPSPQPTTSPPDSIAHYIEVYYRYPIFILTLIVIFSGGMITFIGLRIIDFLSTRNKKRFFLGDSKEKLKRLNELSISYPKNVAKGFSSLFLIQIYASEFRFKVTRNVNRAAFGKKPNEYSLNDLNLYYEQIIRVELIHPDIRFSRPIIISLNADVNVINIIGEPTDDCKPGNHRVVCNISSSDGRDLISTSFTVQVTDFVFGYVSRPLLSTVMSGILGVGSFVVFMLTLLGRIDSTFGYTAGTTAGALASAIYWNFFSLYKKSGEKKVNKLDMWG